MDEDIKKTLLDISNQLAQHRADSRARDLRLTDRIEKVDQNVKKAQEKADLAHAVALEAKHAANRASDTAEGGDHSIFAELGSLKVVLDEHTAALKAEKDNREKEKKLDNRARKQWRLATPTIVAVVVVLSQQLVDRQFPNPHAQQIAKQAAQAAAAEMKDGGTR